MGSYRLSRDIDAPPDRVFAAFTDPELMADWMDLSHVNALSGPFGEPGSTFTMVVAGPHRFRSQVLASRPPTYHEWSGRGLFGAAYHMTATLTGDDDGTHLDLMTDYTMPLGPLGRWIDRRWIDRPERSIANREVDRLVVLVSAGAGS
jgi:uncharacterized protein YndB with AHSA1/START domain